MEPFYFYHFMFCNLLFNGSFHLKCGGHFLKLEMIRALRITRCQYLSNNLSQLIYFLLLSFACLYSDCEKCLAGGLSVEN